MDIESPAHYPDIRNWEELKNKVQWLREASIGKPIGVKLAAGCLEEDLAIVLHAEPDYITIDGRAGGTGSAPKFIKAAARLENVLNVSTGELENFARLTGSADVHVLSVSDLCTTNSEISNHTEIRHV